MGIRSRGLRVHGPEPGRSWVIRNKVSSPWAVLVGYDFGPVIMQAYVTTEVSQNNYGGHDTRGWGRIILPLRKLFEQPAPAPIMRKY